jgi:PhnB protein
MEMSINAYINFNGNCKEALAFYADVFEVEHYDVMTWGEMPPGPDGPAPEHVKDLVMHAYLPISGGGIMLSDAWPEMTVTFGDNISLTVMSDDETKLKQYFEKMKAGGVVTAELAEAFFTKLYGSVTDKFGIPWQFLYDEGM